MSTYLGCDQEISGLPVLNSCPVGSEYILLIGVSYLITLQNPGGYGLISYSNFIKCQQPNIQPLEGNRKYPQIVVKDSGSLIVTGQTDFTIFDNDAADGFVYIFKGGGTLTPNNNDVILLNEDDYTSIWSPGRIDITFSDPAVKNDIYNISYPITHALLFETALPDEDDLVYRATLSGAETSTLLNISGNIFSVLANTIGIINISILCTTDDKLALVESFQISAKNINGTITHVTGNNPVLQDDFNDDLGISILDDNILQGIKIVASGIAGKTIYCEATFDFDRKNFGNNA